MRDESKIIQITIPVEPLPFARAGSFGKRRFTPTKQGNFMTTVLQYGTAAMAGRKPLEGPLAMETCFLYVRPASWSQKRKDATYWKTSRPDVDNLDKIIKDALEGCCYLDDAQIAVSVQQKCYAEKHGVSITIYPLTPRKSAIR